MHFSKLYVSIKIIFNVIKTNVFLILKIHFGLNPKLFMHLLIYCFVLFCYYDILYGIIGNIILNKTNNHLIYSSLNVMQNKNKYNLINDFKNEYE